MRRLASLLLAGCVAQQVPDGGVPLVNSVVVELPELADAGPGGDYRTGASAYHYVSAWAVSAAEPLRRQYLEQAHPGVVVLALSWPSADALAMPPLVDFEAQLEQRLAPATADVLHAGGDVFVHLESLPRWASSRPNDTQRSLGGSGPPFWSCTTPRESSGDFPDWSEGVERLTRWLARRWPAELAAGRLSLGYGVELDNNELCAPLTQYAPALNAAARAAKRGAPAIRVYGGGRLDRAPAKTSPAEYQTASSALESWLADCQALHCPLDGLFGHNTTLLPNAWGDAGSAYDDVAISVRDAAAQAGFPEVKVLLTDWTTWELKDLAARQAWLSSEHDTEYKAAHYAASMISMKRAGIDFNAVGTLFEHANVAGEFVGDWGLFTNAGITKPVFQAAALVSKLSGGTAVRVPLDDPELFVVATREGSRLRLLVARFVPDTTRGNLLLAGLSDRLVRLGYTPARLAAELATTEAQAPTRLLELVTRRSFETDQQVSAPLREQLRQWAAFADSAKNSPSERSLELRLPAGLEVKVLRHESVSSERGNAYTRCVRQHLDCTDALATSSAVTQDRLISSDQGAPSVPKLVLGRAQVDFVELEVH